ncbi:MAG TPA: Uma2 family endonuclease [Blastocatellia bacterium]|nr:Uma2 family endonuclease [Blastocatellia bacterium]HMV84441.1 Uma2 family endonuclease [Blastocatellia bacterium]HMY72950.1 Uma2 family endonuclease [Blastocatellia bacterium]HMZ21252.1 Uma2 family endonuclease [Blastocatellia bacterium]HNG31253.1 Uma2 family endonuclease [Blastocatellia bacterium]
MSKPQARFVFTEEQYLDFERNSDERHEYLDGHLILMAGESDDHGDISANLVVAIGSQLRGKPCRVRTKDTKVRSGPRPRPSHNTKGLYSYPDLVVICGEPQHLDSHRDVITNPAVIIEVLSPTTEDFDRRVKFGRYREWNETLTDYLLVSQNQAFVEHFLRREDGEWLYRSYWGLEREVPIDSIQCTLLTTEIYDRISFPAVPNHENEEAEESLE